MTLELYLVRHADAGDPESWKGDDALRPLSRKGQGQAERLGRHLVAIDRRPDAIVTSPKVRALQTAALVAEGWKLEPIVDERLASGFDLGGLSAVAGDHRDARRLMVVGHDPDFSTVASTLVGVDIAMKKAALARIDVAGPIAAGGGALRWLIPPDALPK